MGHVGIQSVLINDLQFVYMHKANLGFFLEIYYEQAAKLIGPPATFDASKLEVIFKGEEKDQYTRIIPRTYNLSHCDFTADLTLTISNVIDHDQVPIFFCSFLTLIPSKVSYIEHSYL